MTGLETHPLPFEAGTRIRAKPPIRSIPIFDASGDAYQRLGLLSLTETAARRGGDAVLLRLSAGQSALLLSGPDGADHFACDVAGIPAERGDVTSNATAVHLLLGDSVLAEAWRRGKLAIDERLRLEQARAAATTALLHSALRPQGSDQLRTLCKLWSVRACCPALLGDALAEADLIEGFLRIESFFTALNGVTKPADRSEAEDAFKKARVFVDDALAAALIGGAGDDNVVCQLSALLPSSYGTKKMIDELRPVIFGLLFEAIQIDGLNLLWTLAELARGGAFVEAIAMEGRSDDAVRAGPLARAVAMEALRLYPELPLIRRTGPASDLSREWLWEEDILYAPWLIHRDARLWPEPARFLPQRFLSTVEGPGLPDFYMPFGLGPLARHRTQFVVDQIAATITTICKNACFSLAPGCRPGDLRPVYRAVLEPRGNVDVHWQRRPDKDTAPHAPLETEKSDG